MRFFDSRGKQAPDPSGDYIRLYKYNEKRQVTEILHFGPGVPRTDSVFRHVNRYDPTGKRISQTDYDARGRVMEDHHI